MRNSMWRRPPGDLSRGGRGSGFVIKPWILNISDHFLSASVSEPLRSTATFDSVTFSLIVHLSDNLWRPLWWNIWLRGTSSSPRRAVVSQKRLFPSICCGITVCSPCSCDHRQAGSYQAYKKQLRWALIVPVCVFQFHTMWSCFDSRGLDSLTCTELSTHD